MTPTTASLCRTSSGASASTSDVSVRPACASAPRSAGVNTTTTSPSLDDVHTTRSSASAFPPCPETTTTARAQSRAERMSSVSKCASASVPTESVPANPACSPLAPTPISGATTTSRRCRASASHSAAATSVSVDSGRCGPCCSHEPSGTARTWTRTMGRDLRPGSLAERGTVEPSAHVAADAAATGLEWSRCGLEESRTAWGAAVRPWPCTQSGSGPSSGQPGEELGRHAPAPARVPRPARGARARAAGCAQRGEQRRVAPHRREAARHRGPSPRRTARGSRRGTHRRRRRGRRGTRRGPRRRG